MSFAFRPKDYYADVYSFYYFRVLYFKKSETVYFPIDSYLGNLCVPKNEDDSNNNKTNKYYCNLILKNNYNYLSIKFSLTSTTQNEYFLINTTKVFTNNNRLEESYQFIYLHTNLTENIDYYLFKMEFQNQEIKNIITSFIDIGVTITDKENIVEYDKYIIKPYSPKNIFNAFIYFVIN